MSPAPPGPDLPRSRSLDLEAEYNNRARVPEHPAHIAAWREAAEAYRAQARMEPDIAYGNSEREKLDLFLPAGGEAFASAMFIHGGYWQALDRSFFSHVARGLNAHGFAVAVPSYDLCPTVTIDRIVEEMRAAALWMAQRFGRPLLVSGHSAGGHLAACLLATDWAARAPGLGFDPVPAAYSVSGLFDLAPLVETSINHACRMDAEAAARLSPILWPAPAGKHLLAVVGGREGAEYHRQSRDMAETWQAGGTHASWRAVPDADHFMVVAPLDNPASVMSLEQLALARASGVLPPAKRPTP
jgi:arylformamidase